MLAHIWNVLEKHKKQREEEGNESRRRKAKDRVVQSHKRNVRPTHSQTFFPKNRTWRRMLYYRI